MSAIQWTLQTVDGSLSRSVIYKLSLNPRVAD